MKNNQKGFANVVLIGLIVIFLGIGGYFAWSKKSKSVINTEPLLLTNPQVDTSNWKTYTNTKQGFSFQYPEKLALSSASDLFYLSLPTEAVYLSHSIPFENHDGGCDLKGDSKLSKTLNDFSLAINMVSGEVNPSYVDGDYSAGILNGKWSYMGVKGCGETNYYFPIAGNRTLVFTMGQVQILSDVVSPDIKAKVLAAPGVISQEESKIIFDQILSTFKFIPKAYMISDTGKSTTNQLIAESKIIESLKTNWQSIQASIPFRPGHPGTISWGSPMEVQFIGNDNLLVYFEDGYNPGMVVLNFSGSEFKILEAFKNQGNFLLSDWQNLVNKYGVASYPVSTYTISLLRNKEIISFPDLTNVPENVFLKSY